MEYVPAKTIVTKTKGNEWFGIDYNMNIYRGCCHGCIYCDSRSDCYQIKNFDQVKAKKIEPEVAISSERFAMLEHLAGHGIFAGILLMPVLPWLEDSEENMLAIVRRAHEVGAKFIYAAFGMTLRNNQREWYFDQLNRLFPEERLVERYIKQYGNRYECRSPRAAALWKRFAMECEKYGILYQMKDIIHAYRRGYEITQLNLFDI